MKAMKINRDRFLLNTFRIQKFHPEAVARELGARGAGILIVTVILSPTFSTTEDTTFPLAVGFDEDAPPSDEPDFEASGLLLAPLSDDVPGSLVSGEAGFEDAPL